MPDAIFDDPTLARLYDPLDPDRGDLDAYLALARELSARQVLDVGCGTGTFALLLAAEGVDVVGVDPAAASLDVARAKPGAERVRWLHGDATSLPALQVDLATMTGNVAQVFLTDAAWTATLRGVRAALAPGGYLVFETRDPARRYWERWTREHTFARTDVPGVGIVETWTDLTDVSAPFVTFHGTIALPDGRVLHSDSTLRFREHDEIEASLDQCGYVVEQVRDAPDRPGLEWVFVARAAG
ncbi:class I SAM-dependent methyltransferase [Krasilnikoviella flava]|uniref:Ubiquinone/menaquinone biosynthesis C-methylase UbiE n=1 Tax=Krasilnikoviella flava TaxID=526729 RepID=A0A1T5LIE7_9MICO|nr:class I SAM-dependent methyltransferase [Krasilnikoviella flava]SKC75767.1 Ubiquinone/menaquinone biosynthesis C-methylase UbiE [Krasilnikoviella flava]